MFNARMNPAINRWCNWNDGDTPHSELETVLHREASSAVAIYYLGTQICYIARHLLLQSIASGLRKRNLLVVLSTYSYRYHSAKMPSTR
jgi:hypothetical protein